MVIRFFPQRNALLRIERSERFRLKGIFKGNTFTILFLVTTTNNKLSNRGDDPVCFNHNIYTLERILLKDTKSRSENEKGMRSNFVSTSFQLRFNSVQYVKERLIIRWKDGIRIARLRDDAFARVDALFSR